VSDTPEKLSAPERWALLAARSTATEWAPIGVFFVLSGLLIGHDMSLPIFMLVVMNATMVWERLGFTRLLRRKNRPPVIEHTSS
jgi:hypothetical protein